MKVLVPLPFDVSRLAHGRNLRIVYLLQELAKNHQVTCLTLNQQTAQNACSVLVDVKVIPAIPRPTCTDHHQAKAISPTDSFLAQSPWLRKAFNFFGYHPHLMQSILCLAPRFDTILGFDTTSVAYLAAVSEHCPKRPQIVCDMIDDPWLNRKSLSRKYRWSLQGLKAAAGIYLIRKQTLSKFDALVAVAEKDAACLSRACGKKVHVIPNGVHLSPDKSHKHNNEPVIVFTGAMDFPPNEAAAIFLVRKIWPRVLRRFNTLATQQGWELGLQHSPKLVIAGANPTRKVQKLNSVPGVQVTGYVPNLRARLNTARLAVAPMVSGCGMKNKVLEALAASCPVVATPRGAAGLPTGEDVGILVARSAGQLAELVFQLLVNSLRAQAVGAAGQQMVQKHFSWPIAGQLLHNVLTSQLYPLKDTEPQQENWQRPKNLTPITKEAVSYAAS